MLLSSVTKQQLMPVVSSELRWPMPLRLTS